MTTIIPAVWAFVTALWAQVTATLAAMAATGVLIPAAVAAVAAIALLATGITLLVNNQKEQYDSTKEASEAINAWTGATETATEAADTYGDTATDAFNQASNAANATVDSVEELTQKTKILTGVQEAAVGAHLAYTAIGMKQVLTSFQFEQMQELGRRGGLPIPGLQAGGIVTKPTMALVGEKGPEAVVPLDKMGGITINFTEPVFMDNEGTMNKFVAKIERVIKRNQRLNFGGAYSG